MPLPHLCCRTRSAHAPVTFLSRWNRHSPRSSHLLSPVACFLSSWWCSAAVWVQTHPLRYQFWSSCRLRQGLPVSARVWFWTRPTARTADPCWKWYVSARRRAQWTPLRLAWWRYGKGRTGLASPPRQAGSRGTWWRVGGRWAAPHLGISWWFPSAGPRSLRSHWTPWRRGCRPAGGTWWCRTCLRPRARRQGRCCPRRWGQCQQDLRPPPKCGSPTASHGRMPEEAQRMTR